MSKFKKSQILMLFLLAILLFVTPLISSSSRPKYFYFIINVLILALGAEAGLISVFSKPNLEDKKIASPVPKRAAISTTTQEGEVHNDHAGSEKKGTRVVEKSASEKIISVVKVDKKVRKCPSTPSLFFIGGAEAETADAREKHVHEEEEEEAEEEIGGLSGQELFTKAETFIGNFYKQLKMQREESWKRIHGLYQKAF